ncbi:uncharacterized protein LOC123502264 [Portunus trituberculatus]|uniref:uncharacterized protein LOC123502264 n=1 Tax=Portunus trituberculatus TaxID=210409 RepID=UPI001E1CB828|nr:uncharacterized protein LOC123502264 [Portunus trituberculatus]
MELWHKLFTIRRKNEPNRTQKTAASRETRCLVCFVKKNASSCYLSVFFLFLVLIKVSSVFCERRERVSECEVVSRLAGVAQEKSAPLLLQKEDVRVLLFRECDTRGRKLLYDSKTVLQVPLGDAAPHAGPPAPKALFKGSWGSVGGAMSLQAHKTPVVRSTAGQRSEAFAEVCGGYGYQYQQKEGDTKAVGELVFGSVDLAYRGSCSKLHLLQEPPQRVLLSRTAPAPTSHLPRLPAASDPGIEDSSFSSSISSLSDGAVTSGSLEVPWGVGGSHTLAMKVPQCLGSSLSEGDSGFGGPPSPYSSTCGSFLSPVSVPNTPHGTPSSRQGSGNSLKNSGSLNSLQRRFLRSVNTSLEALGVVEEGGRGASPSHHTQRRTTKLGLAVLIQLQGQHHQQESVEDWLFLHLGVIESAINKLQTALHSAYLHRQSFVSTTHAAVSKLQQDLVDLVSGPRLGRPVWLGLLGQSAAAAERHALCCSFVDTLAAVLSTFDTKHTNFFVSKLLTAVLTHHLGWVSTVAPSDPPPLPPPPPSPTATTNASTTTPGTTTTTTTTAAQIPPFTPAQPSWAERLSESHPYSAVWAQLCELSGAVGYPPRAARTVLLGSNTTLLHHLLTILSYIIRCSQVVEQQVEAPQDTPTSASALPKHLQTSSQCSSAASISTIVEEVPGLQRDASLRHSRRAARGGVRGQEARGGAGEGVEQGKDAGEGKRWMLNDGEEIVIRVVSEGGRPSSPASPQSPQPPQQPQPSQHPQGTPQPPPQSTTSVTETTSLSPPPPSLSTSKTSFNLSSLACEEEEEGDAYLPPAPPSGLYPPLHHLDDHRETFGPVVLEPGKIAEKVQKLFRSSSQRETDATAHTQTPQPTQMSLTTPSLTSQPSKHPMTHTQPQQAPVPPPRTKRSMSKSECIPSESDTAGLRKVHPDSVVIPAKDIQPEVEEGGRVLLLHHNTPPHPHTLTPQRTAPRTLRLTHTQTHAHTRRNRTYMHTRSRTYAHTHMLTHKHAHTLNTHIHTKLATGYSGLGCGGLAGVQGARVICLPHPVDTRRRVRLRNVGRESVRDLTKLERTVYPALSHLKEDMCKPSVQTPRASQGTGGLGVASCGARDATQTHRRHHSDPTNGVFTTSPPPSLKDVLEEQTETKTPAHPHTCREGVEGVEVGEVVQEKKDEEQETQGQAVTEAREEPVVIGMPKCVYTTTTTTTTSTTTTRTQRHGLAGSLLGGVLDHYASPFILHATTQTQRWEDMLRQDLSSAAHHSPLDPQLAEAVAVVADTDSWEVQVVSSHSYVVGGSGGGGVVGLRVDASPLVSSITDSVLDLTRLGISPLFVVQHMEQLLSELYLKSQLLAQYLLGGAMAGGGGATAAPYHLPDLTRSLGLDVNDLPLLLAVASTHTPALTHMYGLCVR